MARGWLRVNVSPEFGGMPERQFFSSYLNRPMQAPSATVAILLCTYRGQDFLPAQLASIYAQSHRDWTLWVSDDGSDDATSTILVAAQRELGNTRMHLITGPRKGFVANFLSQACNQEIEADYFSYADQDDVWDADKLERALQWLAKVPQEIPALYCGRVCLVDQNDRRIGMSPLFKRPPSFANALLQNIAGGNTMVFNRAARNLLRLAGAEIDVVMHDWWTYLAVAGAGGRIFYDSHPALRYRQHSRNIVGMNTGWWARLLRLRSLWSGQHRDWIDSNIRALSKVDPKLSSESQVTLQEFARARDGRLLARLFGIWRSGVYRQTVVGNLALMVAAIGKKI